MSDEAHPYPAAEDPARTLVAREHSLGLRDPDVVRAKALARAVRSAKN
jgi:hypothetical protein